ncbi:uncharacterized protein LOC141597313 [Silene latifolia]|uniref:uncharacterized protein LOC141597313 n=1 Tax=Silene latifolia TaxID=37657 RepID=UPI003D7759F1
MEKDNKFKLLKFPSFFTSSCKTQNISEVIDHNQNPIILQSPTIEKIQNNLVENEDNLVIKPKQTHYSPINNVSSSSTSLMMCKPKCPQTYDHNATVGNRCSRRKVVGKWSLLSPYADFSGRKCPPTSPASPLHHKQGKKNKNKKTTNLRSNYGMKNGFKQNPFSISSSNETDDNGDWFSSDNEREDYEKQTMLSLKSFSFSSKSISFSSESDTPENKTRTQTQTQARDRPRVQRRKRSPRVKEVGVVPFQGEVKDSLESLSFSSKFIFFSSESDTPDNQTRTQTQTQTQTHARDKPRLQRRKPSSRVREVGVVPFEGRVKDSLESLSFSSSKSIYFSCESDTPDNQTQTQTQTQTKTRTRDRSRVQRRKPSSKIKEVGVVPLEGKVKDTYAIVKSSSDPYNDFRVSMVEMIIEKKIFRAKELKQLLECFISLNSCHHHRVILEVFTEICDALFSYC